MRKRMMASLAMLLMTGALAGCGIGGSSGTSNNPPADPTSPPSASAPADTSSSNSSSSPSPSVQPTEPGRPGDEAIWGRIDSMTLEQKVGQLAVIGLEGKSMDKAAQSFIQQYHVGGFILFKDNIESANQTLRLLNQLKEMNRNSPNSVPLWLSVDQEGGKVSRLPAEFKKTPTARDIAGKNNPKYTYAIGQSLGLALGSLGFNMDFAPVLDINSNPNNPVIGDRSFGSDASAVILHGMEMMKGITSQGVAAVVKHFPGHGDTSVDSHKQLPVVNKSLEELSGFELLPFQEAIRSGADAVMVGHLLMKKLDPDNPASISKAVVTDLLREKLGFNGVVITDDMTMKGLTEGNDIGAAAVDAILAGGDVLLVCHENELQKKVLDTVIARVKDGTVSQQRLDDSVYRILSLKAKYKINDDSISSVDPDAINAEVNQSLNRF